LNSLERKDESDWVLACRELQIERTKTKANGRKTWSECVKFDMKGLGLSRRMLIIEISGEV